MLINSDESFAREIVDAELNVPDVSENATNRAVNTPAARFMGLLLISLRSTPWSMKDS
jgi:hypothetical protein